MPLIIVILAIIVLFSWANNSSKNSYNQMSEHTASARKTDAETERALVDKYMKSGMLFDDAFEKSRSDMIENGFDPCIPKSAYKERYWHTDLASITSECRDCTKYDSRAVRNLRGDYERECRDRGVPGSKEEERKYIYQSGKLPTSPWQYSEYLSNKKRLHVYDAVPVGKYISYLGVGTCEVIDLDFEKGMHTVKVIKTGAIMHIPFGSNRITKL